MKQMLRGMEGKRPYLSGLVVVVLVGATGSLLAVADTLAAASRMMLLLGTAGLKFMPPVVWIAGVLIAALWGAVMKRLWRT